MMEKTPIEVFADQMIFSDAARAKNWKADHVLGTTLEPLLRSGDVRLRPSAAHYNETVLFVEVDESAGCALRDTPRLDERQQIAQLIFELCDFDRPVHRWDVRALRDLAEVLRGIVPTSIVEGGVDGLLELDKQFIRESLRRLSIERAHHDADFYRHAWSRKLANQVAQASFRDEQYLTAAIEAVKSGEKLPETPFDLLEKNVSVADLRQWRDKQLDRLFKLDAGRARRLWQKNRQSLETPYVVDMLIGTLDFFLKLQGDVPRVFDLREIAEHWSDFEAEGGVMRLPEPLPDVDRAHTEAGMDRLEIAVHLLQPLVERLLMAAKLPCSRTGMYVASLQVENALGRERPGTGNPFDCERAIALHDVDVFFTLDKMLAHQAKQTAKHLELDDVVICGTEDELGKALDRLLGSR